jgi:hypothetical protein
MAHYGQHLSLRHFLFHSPRQDWFGRPPGQLFLSPPGLRKFSTFSKKMVLFARFYEKLHYLFAKKTFKN